MKKKYLLLTMSLVILSAGLVGCGTNDKTQNELEDLGEVSSDVTEEELTTEPTGEVPEEEDPNVNMEEEDPAVSLYGVEPYEDEQFKVELVDGVLQVTTDFANYTWVQSEVDTSLLDIQKLERAEDDTLDVYTLSPLSEGEMFISFTASAVDETTPNVVYYVDMNVDMDKNVTFIVTPVEEVTEAPPFAIEADEELMPYITAVETAIGSDNMPAVMARSIDIGNQDDMTFVLGVNEITGLEKGVVSEPMMSSIAYSLVVLKFDTNENAVNACAVLEENAPEGKWVCVMPEETTTKVVDDVYVYFFMGPVSSASVVDGM